MTVLSMREFRRRIGELIRSRKPVVLTSRGTPVARLVPMKRSAPSRDRMSILTASDGCIDDPAIPKDGSTRLDEYLYGPTRPRR